MDGVNLLNMLNATLGNVARNVNGVSFISFSGQCEAGREFLESGAPGSQVEMWLCEVLYMNELAGMKVSVAPAIQDWWNKKRGLFIRWCEEKPLRAQALAKLTKEEKDALGLR